jgi:hypothetical protein
LRHRRLHERAGRGLVLARMHNAGILQGLFSCERRATWVRPWGEVSGLPGWPYLI